MNVARFLLRDGNKVGAEVCPERLEVYTYIDQKGQQIHALSAIRLQPSMPIRKPKTLVPRQTTTTKAAMSA